MACRLKLEQRLLISASCIYRHIHSRAGAWRERLRHGRKGYPRRGALHPRGQLKGCVRIAQRPPSVDKRQRIGHWEGDTIVSGGGQRAALVTLVERRSRLMLAVPVRTRQAEPVAQAIIETLRMHRRRAMTLTLDNGKEFAQHAFVAQCLRLKVYFADPHSPWQRGTNENANGLLRQYLPKGSDLGAFTQIDIDEALYRLNHRPRKCLGWRTPHEVYYGFKPTSLTLTDPRTL